MSYSGHSLSSKAWHTELPSNCPRKCSLGHGCWAFCPWDPLPPPRRSGWFPEAYVKPLEEVPMSPTNPLTPVTSMNLMNPMNELPSRSYPLRGSHSLDDLLGRPGNSAAPSEYWDGQSRSRTPSRIPSRAPSPAPPPLPSSRRSSVGSMGVASDVKKLMSSEQHPPELFPRGTNPFATVKLRPTVTNDRSAPLIR